LIDTISILNETFPCLLADIKLILAALTCSRKSIRNCIDKILPFQQFDEHALPSCVKVARFMLKKSSPVALKKDNDVVIRDNQLRIRGEDQGYPDLPQS